ncbi:hypothetical protein NEUTE1DRAFT_87140 [Neurospora tetrasperma FGSC 2508]|uniref:Copper-fist domain-containing protein n=1 Tax=Neurospora tetrasperma (strain FGSC 2508 / ATCC MYA-4615 / P0657) TaxID=510951 RepID=F8MWE8_NEUT8|nr:uncharacterized protein NEUTE1DRAFT_87140 [Neurospora tetrasperma FGSC 2508]EGO54090.1 hypothetical protein NEUTE1DRAFT_87140 [Neurospora tetrasperma FGSC 2508]EGZ68487.1 hypothetical protein NEUTE2DRAFT_118416 [Neurospora tetrasperma FGSC 2509]
MPIINGQKMACAPCIRGHRSTKCTHATERVMVPVRKPGRPLSLCACPNRPPSCSCGGGGVKVAIPRKQTCGCGSVHGSSTEDHSPTAAAQGIPAPRLHASSSTPARPGLRVSKSGSISKPHSRHHLPTFDLDITKLGVAAQHNAALGPNMAGSCCGGSRELRGSQLRVNGSVAMPQSGYGQSSANPMQFNAQPPLQLKEQQQPLTPTVMPFGYQTVFRYPEEYGSWNHPLDPQTYQQMIHQGAAAAQAAQQGGDLSLGLFLSGGGGDGTGTSHECTCGPGCQCIGCVAHPYNSQTIQYVQDAYNFNIASPIGSSAGNSHHSSLDFAATVGVQQQQQQQYQIRSPIRGSRTGQQQQSQQQLPPDSPVEAQTPSDASGTPSEEQYLSTADFLWATIPLPNCAGESLSCPCGDDCACIGCVIHGKAAPSLVGGGEGLEQQQVCDVGQHQQVPSQGHEALMPMSDGLPQGMMPNDPLGVIPLTQRIGMGDMSGLSALNGGGMSSDMNNAVSSPRTLHVPFGIDGILRATASGGGDGGSGSCCGGRGAGGGGGGRSTEVSVP